MYAQKPDLSLLPLALRCSSTRPWLLVEPRCWRVILLVARLPLPPPAVLFAQSPPPSPVRLLAWQDVLLPALPLWLPVELPAQPVVSPARSPLWSPAVLPAQPAA